MKKFIAGLVIVCFLAATMPRPARADHLASPAALGIAFGAVALIITVLTLGTSRDRGKAIEAKKEVDIEFIKALTASGAKVSCGGMPCENSYESSTAGSAMVRHAPIVQPIAQAQPPYSRSERGNGEHSSSEGSALYKAGQEAARNGVEVACTNTSDYCRGYNAAMRGR